MGAGHKHSGSAGAGSRNRRRLGLTLGLVAIYMVAEVVGGLVTNSLALLADAGHMLSDAGALALSLFAIWLAQKPPTPRRSYGFYRSEILAALANGATLVAISIFIFYEAWQRIGEPPEVQGSLMMGIAAGGLLINVTGLWILNSGRNESLNVRGAWLHVLTDALGSVGAIAAGGLIWAFGWNWADPVASILIGLLVIYSSWSLLRETVSVLMESAPSGIDLDELHRAMKNVSGVRAVHDVHVWTITSGMNSLSAHAIVADDHPPRAVLSTMRDMLREQFSIEHTTIQIEPREFQESPAAF